VFAAHCSLVTYKFLVVIFSGIGVLEKTLCVRSAAGPMFTEAEVGAWAGDLLTNLFGALNGNPENEYIMKVRGLCARVYVVVLSNFYF
jgi:hypothetical protein